MWGFCLMLFRLCPAAWAGAAALFVLITVGLTRSPEVDSELRMQLSLIRFPYYYVLEFGLLGTALVAGFFARKHGELGRIRSWLGLGLVALALAGAIADYFLVYRPLEKMMTDRTLDGAFRSLHEASKHGNSTIVVVVVIAALVINWPSRAHRRTKIV